MTMSRAARRSLQAVLAATALSLGTLVGAAPAHADDQLAVTNPSFIQPYTEPTNPSSYTRVALGSDAIPGWRVTHGDVDVFGRAAARTDSSPVVEPGSQAVDLNGAVAGGIEQTLATPPGSQITITFAARVNDHPWCAAYAADIGQSMSVQFAADPDSARFYNLGSVTLPGRYVDWQLVRVVLPATGRHSRLQFLSHTTGHCGPLITDVRATDNSLL